jgi:ABC-type Mn2+/Zn2+ transport system permease subunit
MNLFLEMMSYSFLVRAIIVGILVSLCAALLGTSLVLKRYAMIGDGLSHVGFAAAYPLGFSPLYISIPVCIAAAFFLLQLKDSSRIKGDAATVVLGMRMMGTLLISSLIVFPSLTAMRVTRKFKTTVLLSAVLAVSCFLAGLVFSYLHAVPTGACIVITNIILFVLFSIAEKVKERRRES